VGAEGHGTGGRRQGHGVGNINRSIYARGRINACAGRNVDVLAAVDRAKRPVADIPLEVLVADIDAGGGLGEPRHTEDLAEQVQAGIGGERQERLGDVQELAVLQLGQLVGHDIAKGPRLAA